MSTMLTLGQHIQAEEERWAAEHHHTSPPSVISSSSSLNSSTSTIFDKQTHYNKAQFILQIQGRTLSRRSSTSSFATEFEPEPAVGPFVLPRDFNGAPIPIYASLEAAVAQSTRRIEVMMLTTSTTTTATTPALTPATSAGLGQGQAATSWEWGGIVVIEGEWEGQQEPRRLVTPGKLYENEEDDDEIVYS
ncbi:hypothetical protein F5Y16DRAFT_395202 [Xylariaceae sp. FL0255]|nr:hypothetical protein F5Y16DRAFT_395202 [Xylariaceae sp. FL0255]